MSKRAERENTLLHQKANPDSHGSDGGSGHGGGGNDDGGVHDGAGGSVSLEGGAGTDIFLFHTVTDSTSTTFDKIERFDAAHDSIDLSVAVSGIDAEVTTGNLSHATFDADLTAAVGANQLAAGHAVLFQPANGDDDDLFLIVDANGEAGYQAGQDFVIKIENSPTIDQITAANFITGTPPVVGNGENHNRGHHGNTFVFGAVSDSTSTGFQTVKNFDPHHNDTFNLNFAVSGVDAAVKSGTLSLATFDADLSAAIGANQLEAGHAVVFTASAGTLRHDTFLVVDANGVAGYQAGQDLVVHLDNPNHVQELGAANFI